MMTSPAIHSDLAIPPGEFLLEVASELGMSQADLARRMGRPAQAINEMIKGEKAITPETALQLEQVLNVPAHIWTGLEAEYQLVLARGHETKSVTHEVHLLGRFPYTEMARFNWVKSCRDNIDRVKELRRFFGVASLSNLDGVKAYAPAFRQAPRLQCSAEALAAWLRAGELEARGIEAKRYDQKSLMAELPNIRRFSNSSPKMFLPQLSSSLAKCGIAFILHPHLPKTYVNGATFWLTPDKAVLMMSIRGSWADIFWFSLFHEIGHILLHDKRHMFLENREEDPQWKKQENEADTFAREALIPQTVYDRFIKRGAFTAHAINALAKELEIAPGIVVGRLQHDGHVARSHHHGLRERYKWE